jgi:7-carboxy-7-deazaguanine synthase
VSLRLSEIFFSLQGEARTQGFPTVFIRLSGCPLRCCYCDTQYAFRDGDSQSLEAILTQVAAFDCQLVTVTGGEPLAQPACLSLLTSLADAGYQVSLETGGALDIGQVDARVSRVLDIKTPGSGEMEKNHWENLPLLTPRDMVKFVITDRTDYDWARQIMTQWALPERCEVIFSPSYHQLPARELADWILLDRLPVRFQTQLHKVLWGEERAR